MADQDLLQRAYDLLAAFNSADWERLRALLSDDVIYEETGTQRHIEGGDASVQLCQDWKRAFPDVTGAVRQTAATETTVVLDLIWEGRHHGPLAGTGGVIPATGKRVMVPAVLWLTFAGDRIRSVHHHLDLFSLLQQVGVMAP